MGHEFSGVVDAIGPGVHGWHIGDRVVPLSQISCGQCAQCLAGNNSDCPKLETTDYNPAHGGAYAEYTIVGAGDALPLPDGVSFEEAAAVEPLAVGLDAARRAKFNDKDSLLIIGAGPIGLTIAQWARFFGVRDIVVSEPNASRRKLALDMGCTAAIDTAQEADVVSAFERLTGRRPTVIVEAVGIPGMIQQCIAMAEKESRIVVVGVCMSSDSFEPLACIMKALQLVFAYGYTTADYAYILDLLGARRITAKPLISHRIGLDDLPAVFEQMRRPTDQIKVMVCPDAGTD
jgi:(R,R)-butanediol dehydrogenase/meso-butanediol dehydrogenase/diacetyl reductase